MMRMDDPVDPADLAELARRADENLAATWGTLAASAGAAVATGDRCTLVATGIPAAFFNGAFVVGPVADPERMVADAIAFMDDHDVPWLLWVRRGVADDVLQAGRRAGLVDAGGPPCMILPSIPVASDTPPAPEDLVVAVVDDPESLAVFRDLTVRGFGMPAEIVDRFMTDGVLDAPGIVSVVGSVDGTPVSCAVVSVTGSTAGVYNVGTPPEHRRRGYGAALTWAAIREGAGRGCDHSVLQASELGAPVYRAMGFVEVGDYVQLTPPS